MGNGYANMSSTHPIDKTAATFFFPWVSFKTGVLTYFFIVLGFWVLSFRTFASILLNLNDDVEMKCVFNQNYLYFWSPSLLFCALLSHLSEFVPVEGA